MSRWIFLAAAGLIGSGASFAGAQRAQVTLDAGAATMRYADSLDLTSITIGPTLRWRGRRVSAEANGAFSSIDASAWTASGGLAGSYYVPLYRRIELELAGSAGGSMHQDRTRTAMSTGNARLHAANARRGAWIGAGAGLAWIGRWEPVRLAEAGMWTSVGNASGYLIAMPTIVADSLRYTDVSGIVRHVLPGFELSLSGGTRIGSRLPDRGDKTAWGSVAATWWMASRIGVTGAVGTYPIDYVQGYPGARFASLGIRVRGYRPTLDETGMSAGLGPALALTRDGPGRQEFRLRAPSAKSVEVAGDFNLWIWVPMRRDEKGEWSVVLPVPSGTHQVALRVDGRWLVPSGLPVLDDEYGARTGVLVVP